MDFHCLWHSTLHVPKGYEEWMFTSWHLTMSNKLQEATALGFEDHYALQLTSWLTTSMDRPLTSVLGICEYLARFATGITPLITGLVRWDSLWMRLGFGLAQEPLESLKHCKNAKSLRQETTERPRDFTHLSQTSSMKVVTAQLMAAPACVHWRDVTIHTAWPEINRDRLLDPRRCTFCTLCTVDWTHYSRLDVMTKDCFCLPLRHWWH